MSDTKETAESTGRPGGLVDDDGAVAAAFQSALGGRRARRRREDPPASADQASAGAPAKAEPAGTAEQEPSEADSQPQAGEAPAVEKQAAAGEEPAAIPQQAADPAPATTPAPPVSAGLAVRPAPPVAPVHAQVRPLDVSGTGVPRTPGGQRTTQCTVNVSTSVRDRFAAYQLRKKLESGAEPTNAVVVKRAVLFVRRHDLFAEMLEYARHRQTPSYEEDDDPEGLFGEAPGRRVERGRVLDAHQQTFRPTYDELGVIDAMVAEYGFGNRSVFLDAALEVWLPPLQDKADRRRR